MSLDESHHTLNMNTASWRNKTVTSHCLRDPSRSCYFDIFPNIASIILCCAAVWGPIDNIRDGLLSFLWSDDDTNRTEISYSQAVQSSSWIWRLLPSSASTSTTTFAGVSLILGIIFPPTPNRKSILTLSKLYLDFIWCTICTITI